MTNILHYESVDYPVLHLVFFEKVYLLETVVSSILRRRRARRLNINLHLLFLSLIFLQVFWAIDFIFAINFFLWIIFSPLKSIKIF